MRRKKFYKFQAINDYSISALEQRLMWCSKAKSLNDPYEFRVSGLVDGRLEISQLDEMGITSLAERNDNRLMWAHYADKHQGICLEFSIDGDAWIPETLRIVQPDNEPKWKGGIHKVKYSKKLPVIDTSENNWQKNMLNALLTKSGDWRYEKEWRCIHRVGDKLHPYIGNLSGVIFGCRTSIQNKEKIISILKNDVKYFDSKLSKSEFKVEIIPYLG